MDTILFPRVFATCSLVTGLLFCVPTTRAQRSGATLAYQVTHVDQGEPFFSPDGKKIVFETTVAGFEQIFIMNPDGTDTIQITHDAFNHDSPSWSPDGKKIAFVSDQGGKKRSTS